MRLDCSVVDPNTYSGATVKNESVESLILLQGRLTLDSENPEAILDQKDPKEEDVLNDARSIEGSGIEPTKGEISKVDTSDDEPGHSSAECSSDSDESCPPSPASKCIHAKLSLDFELDRCWSRSESCICEVRGVGVDGKPELEIVGAISTTAGGPFSNWDGLWFIHSSHWERIIYQATDPNKYQRIPTYPEFWDMVPHGSTGATAGDAGNTSPPFLTGEQPGLGGIALADDITQHYLGVPVGSSQTSDLGNLDAQTQEAPSANAGNYPFATSTDDNVTRITLVNMEGITLDTIDEFVDKHWPRNRRKKSKQQVICHICPVFERSKPRPDKRPYALKEHLKSHFFKVQCMWCTKTYSNKANLTKNHSNCPNKPAGTTAETDHYTYVPRN